MWVKLWIARIRRRLQAMAFGRPALDPEEWLRRAKRKYPPAPFNPKMAAYMKPHVALFAEKEEPLVIDPKSPSVFDQIAAHQAKTWDAARQEMQWWYHCGMDQRERCAAARAGRN